MGPDPGGLPKVYYFAYGSNMNWPQMQRRCPTARFVCVARLPDYQLGITRHSRLRRCGTANAFLAPGQEVWGIIYDISDADLTRLDAFEDGYRRERLSFLPNGDGHHAVEALIYLAPLEENVPPASSEYLALILEGARHWNLPSAYLKRLETLTAASAP